MKLMAMMLCATCAEKRVPNSTETRITIHRHFSISHTKMKKSRVGNNHTSQTHHGT